MLRIIPIQFLILLATASCIPIEPIVTIETSERVRSDDTRMPKLMYPVFVRTDLPQRIMTCDDIDREIRKTDSIRWSMQQDGLRARTANERLASRASEWEDKVVLFPVDLINGTRLDSSALDGEFAIDPVTAADYRLIELLKLKRERNCSASANASAEQTDLEVLENILVLQQSFGSGETGESTYIRERTLLLNGLIAEGEMSGVR